MATLPGGTTLTTSGLTQAENTALTTALSGLKDSSGNAVTNIITQTSTPSFADTKATLSTPIIVGDKQVSTVNSVVVAPTTTTIAGGAVLASVDISKISTSSGEGSITNVVVQPGASSIVLSGTATGTSTALFLPTVSGASASPLVVSGDVGDNFVVGSGSSGSLTVVTGLGNDSVIGSSGVNDIKLGGGGIINVGSSNASNTLVGGSASSTIGGGSSGDSIAAGTGGGIFIGGGGSDTMAGGAGKDIFVYSPGDGNDSIVGFDPTKDTLGIASTNFGGKTLDLLSVINNAQVVGGNTILTLPDGSTITVAGATGVNVSWFTAK